MKYKLFGLVSAAVMLIVSVLFVSIEGGAEKSTRIHQHLEARGDTGCDCEASELCTHLSIVIIDTDGQDIPGEPTGEHDMFKEDIYTTAADGNATIISSVTVIDNKTTNNHPSDAADFTTACEIRVRGHSSRYFPKRPYVMKFVDSSGKNNDISVMGMDAHHEWVLHGPILDKSLVRNYMWYNIAGEIMDYAPNVRFCEVILNGEYEGLYVMAESITNGKDGRLNLSMNVKNSESTGYLLRIDRPTESELGSLRDIYAYSERIGLINVDISVRYPGVTKLTAGLAKDIELDYSAFEKALYSFDYDTSDYGYRNMIDVDNFIDYFILNEITGNYDAGRYSTYIYKEVGEKLRLCVWDFNNCCDNYPSDPSGENGFSPLKERGWYAMLFKDEAFVEQLIARWAELRKTYLSDEYLDRYIDQTLQFLGPAISRNNLRWADEIAGTSDWIALTPEDRDLHSHEEAVAQLKGWLSGHSAWLDQNIHVLRQYAHPSRNKKYNY